MKSHRTRLLTLCVLACCLFAVASTASTLDESVSTDPSDAIDPDWEELPIGKEEASELRERTQSKPADTGTPSAERAADGDSETKDESGSGDESARSSNGGGPGDAGTAGGSGESGEGAGGQRAGERGGTSVTVSLLARLLELLAPLLLGLLVLGGIAVGVIVLRRLRPDGAATVDDTRAGLSRAVGPPSPSNDVSRAWFELMRRFGVADEHQLTPRERAELAIERGADANSVQALTELFEQTRYGDTAVTDGARDRALELFERATDGSRSREGWT